MLVKKTSGNFLFNSVLNFSVVVIALFTWLQNELIDRSQRSNKTIPYVSNKFVVFFNTSATAFFVFCFFPTKEMVQANSHKRFNFFPETPRATFLEVNKLLWIEIKLNRKSAEHLRTILGDTGQLFRPYKVSSAVNTVISTTGDRTSDHRLQCRNSTTEPPVHIVHNWRQIN